MPCYAIPIQSGGGGIPVFSGDRRHQVGGNIWSTLRRLAIPIGRKILSALRPHATRFIGRVGSGALNVGGHTAADLAAGDFKGAIKNLKQRTVQAASNLGRQTVDDVFSQVGSGRKRKAKCQTGGKSKRARKTGINKRKKGGKKTGRKRKADIFG